MTADKQQAIMDKIQKLLTLGESKVNQNEAQAAMKKAHELMQQYAIDEAKLMKAKRGGNYKMVVEEYIAPRGGLLWETLVVNYMAPVFDCKVVFFKRGAKKDLAKIAGNKADVVTCKLMADYALQVVNRLTSERHKKIKAGEVELRPGESSRSHLHSFRLGIVQAFEQTLARLVKEDEKEQRKESGYGVILADKQSKVEKFYKEQFPNAKVQTVSPSSRGSGMAAGREAGSKVGFSKQAGGGAPVAALKSGN